LRAWHEAGLNEWKVMSSSLIIPELYCGVVFISLGVYMLADFSAIYSICNGSWYRCAEALSLH
jgi:hypothetical protein